VPWNQEFALSMIMAGRLGPLLSRLNFRRVEECSTVITWLDARPGERILDIGCGDGSYDWRIARSGAHVTGVDTHVARMETARRCYSSDRTAFLLADAESVSLPDASFDKAVSLCVMEHLSHDEQVMATVARALKPRGRFVFSADSLSNAGITRSERDRHQARYAVNTFYTIEIVREKLAKAGFAIETARYILSSPFELRLFRASWRLDDLRGAVAMLRPLGYLALGAAWAVASRFAGPDRASAQAGLTLLISARKLD
jgi:2-polyprenyl-3-methyl-5-hydroxy-6-metoxy-1,4-benzoquinol methylase